MNPNLAILLRHPLIELARMRSEEHTSELQSRLHLVCRLLLEKKKLSGRGNRGVNAACPHLAAFVGGRGRLGRVNNAVLHSSSCDYVPTVVGCRVGRRAQLAVY